MRYLALALFAATIPAANWMIGNVGTTCIPDGPCLIPVGFGLMAPSGVLMIGLALVLRDWLHELAGVKWSIAAVLAGGALSLFVAQPALAVASALSFVLAELADLGVYVPLRKRGAGLAVMASGVIGAIVDSALFLWIAFGSFDHVAGLVVAKIYASLIIGIFLMMKARRVFA